MRACTQIYILALSVKADLCVLRQILDQLYLVRLLLLLHELNGLISRQGEALQSQVLFHDLLHLCFQSGQIICGKGIRTVKVIVKALCDRRTDGQLRLREQTLHCLCQNVGCGMPECSLSLLVIKGMQHQGAVLVTVRMSTPSPFTVAAQTFLASPSLISFAISMTAMG